MPNKIVKITKIPLEKEDGTYMIRQGNSLVLPKKQ